MSFNRGNIMDSRLQTQTVANDFLELTVLNYGSRIMRLRYKWNLHASQDMVLNYVDSNQYLKDSFYINAFVAPHAGRIKDGTFMLRGQKVQLETNSNGNNLHSGSQSTSLVYFDLEKHHNSIISRYENDDFKIKIIYSLIDNRCDIQSKVTAKKDCLLNPTHHTYFTLGSVDIRELSIMIPSNIVFGVDETGCPSFPINTQNTVFDFNRLTSLEDLDTMSHPQFEITKHVDHPFILSDSPIILQNRLTGLICEIDTDAPVAVVYFGNYLGDTNIRPGFSDHAAIAIEAQMLPNGVNLGDKRQQIFNAYESYQNSVSYSFTPAKDE